MSGECVCSFCLLRELRIIPLIWSIIEFGPWACHTLLRDSSRWERDEKKWQREGDRRRHGRAREGVEKEEVAYGWKMRECTERRKGRCRRQREDTALHFQSSVRLHKYWAHGRVAGSQVNMTYEYCRSHSLPSCPPQLLMSGSELAQL